MSGETEADISGWTVDTLHSHLTRIIDERNLRYNERFDAQEKANSKALEAATKATDAALAAVEKANVLAATNIDKWQASANEWRAAMNDREATFLPRAEYDESRKATRAFTLAVVAAMVGIVGVLVAIVSLATQ